MMFATAALADSKESIENIEKELKRFLSSKNMLTKRKTNGKTFISYNFKYVLSEKEMAEETAAAEEPEERLAYVGEIALLNVDEKTAACIMAIVSDETKIPLSQLIFRSIRALD
jgi:hypothetical protein